MIDLLNFPSAERVFIYRGRGPVVIDYTSDRSSLTHNKVHGGDKTEVETSP
jgi:hypothetical protein